jgi:hypothetical protein
MEKPAVHGIVKIGKRQHLEALRSRGEVYLNTWGHFQRLEENLVQGDYDEGLSAILQVARGLQLHVEIDGKFEPIPGLFGQMRFRRADVDEFNLFCMFGITDESFNHLNDPRLLEFGDTALLFLNGDEFLKRLRKAIDDLGMPHDSHLVSYVDREVHEGEMGPFRKLSPYSYQSELRFLVHSKSRQPLTLKVGCLEDISVLVPTGELTKKCRIISEDDGQ